MKGTDRIEALARKLGEAIAAHERCGLLKAAAKAVETDAAAQQLEKDYHEAVELLRSKAAAGRPLEPEEKRREAELREEVATSPTIQAYVRAQADFQELMHLIHSTIEKQIGD